MKKRLVFSLIALAGAGCQAAEAPAVGMLEQIPVTPDGAHVIARPIYILTRQKLSTPTVFSGLLAGGDKLSVACCLEVKNPVPIKLESEFAKYGRDAQFVEHMKSIKGYRYVYAAQPTADTQRWTPLMKTLAKIASNPQEASPFSSAVVAEIFDRPQIPASFVADGTVMTLRRRDDDKAGRMIHVFTQGGTTIEFSEDDFGD